MPVPLTFLSEGDAGRIVVLNTGRGFRQRMSAFGFAPGMKVRLIRKNGYGPIIVELNGTARIAIGWGQASKIMVEPVVV